MSNARNLSNLFSLAAHVTNLIGLSGSKTSIDSAVAQGPIPAGAVFDFAGSSAPTGYLLAYGQAVSRTTYAALFAAIGTTHGAGDGSTTFNVPDLRGRVVAGKDDMGGSAASRLTNTGTGNPGINGATLGAAGGGDRHVLTIAQMPAQDHAVNQDPTAGSNNGISRTASSIGASSNSYVDNTGGSEAHPNVQPTIILNKIIKT